MTFSTSTEVFGWKPAAWLRVTGEDAANFLQGQFTNELRRVAVGEAVYGLWLNVKGKVVADSFVIRMGGVDTGGVQVTGDRGQATGGGAEKTGDRGRMTEDRQQATENSGQGTEGRGQKAEDGKQSAEGAGRDAGFWVGSYFSPAAVIKERLESFIIADDVTIEDVTAEWAGVAVVGENLEVVRAMAREVGETAVGGGGGVVFRGRRMKDPVVEWVFPVAQMDGVKRAVGGRRDVGGAVAERWRIAAGIPKVPVDIGPGDLPGEGALEAEAISYTKGCYLGQEVMARLKSMGQVRRRLLRVAGEGEAPGPLPAALFVGERKVGELRSVARAEAGAGGWVGLAMLSLLHVSAGAKLALAVDGAAVVRLTEAP